MDDLNQDQKPQGGAAEQILKVLQKEYVLMGKTRVKAWHMWLAAGLLAGAVGGVFLVANKSGRFAPSEAASGRPATIHLISPNGGEQWQIGSTQQIIFETQRAPRDTWYEISHFQEASGGVGSAAQVIVSNYTGGSPYAWQIPASLAPGGGHKVSITMRSPKIKQGQVTDTSDMAFNLVSLPPTYTWLPVPSNTLVNGDVVLYRFSAIAPVTSDASINEFSFTVSASGATANNFRLYAYADSSFSISAMATNPISTSSTTVIGGTIGGSNGSYPVTDPAVTFTMRADPALVIPAGTTRYLELYASILNSLAGGWVTSQFDALGQQTLSK